MKWVRGTTLKGLDGKTPTEEDLVQLIKPLIPEPIPGKDGFVPIKGIDFDDGKTPTEEELKQLMKPLIPEPATPSSVESPEQTAIRLSALEGWLDVSAIAGLKESIDSIRRSSKKAAARSGGSSLGLSDLTDQCNGVTKTFTVPAHNPTPTILMCTQFPRIYRPTVDYTSGGTTLTLTSEVGAPQTLQTLLFIFVAG